MTTKTELSTFPELFDWQKEHASNLVTSVALNGYAKDGSDTGTGKTFVALHVAKVLGLEPFVLCPKAVVPSWKEAAKLFGYKNPHVYTYEKMRRGNTEYYRDGKWRLRPAAVLMIFDEDHRCKGSKSENAKMMIRAKSASLKILCLGATSCTNPTEMRALGYVLEMHDDRGWYRWCLKNGCKRGVFGGLTFGNAKSVLKRLHDHIYKDGRGSRIKIADLPPGAFPDNLVMADGYDLSAADDITKIYDDLKDELLELEEKKDRDEGDSPLIAQLRARQEVELLKVPLFEDLARDAYENGNSVVLFVNFRQTMEALLKRLAGLCEIRMIHGGQTETERELQCLGFENDVARIMICTIQAGGTGLSLHDKNGNHPRVALISPSFSAIDFRQALGRIHRAGAKTPAVQKIVFAEGTVEMRVCKLVRAKLNNLDLINDDELNPVL
jgi:superfamily II DNA or RNA helicase